MGGCCSFPTGRQGPVGAQEHHTAPKLPQPEPQLSQAPAAAPPVALSPAPFNAGALGVSGRQRLAAAAGCAAYADNHELRRMARSLDQYCDPDAGGLGFSAAMEALGEAVQLERAAQDSCKDSLWDYLPKELAKQAQIKCEASLRDLAAQLAQQRAAASKIAAQAAPTDAAFAPTCRDLAGAAALRQAAAQASATAQAAPEAGPSTASAPTTEAEAAA